MRVTFVVRSLATGGAERQVVAVSRLLAQAGHDVKLIVLSRDLSMGGPLHGTNVQVVLIEKKGRWPEAGWVRRFRAELRRSLPGILCPWMPAEGLMTWASAAGLPGLRLLWSVRTSHLDLAAYDRTTAFVFKLHRLLVRLGTGDGVVFNSRAGADSYGITPDADTRRVIWNSIDFDTYRPDRNLGRQWLTDSGFSPTTPLVVSIGRLSPEKDHLTFVRASRLVLERNGRVRFAIAGSGSPAARSALAQAICDNGLEGCFDLLGNRGDVTAILNAASVVVSSSRCGEGVQNSLAEAMACGRPIVATDVGDAATFLPECDSLVPPGDVVQLAAAIVEQLGRDSDSLTGERIRKARGCFSPEMTLRQWEDCLTSLSKTKDKC